MKTVTFFVPPGCCVPHQHPPWIKCKTTKSNNEEPLINTAKVRDLVLHLYITATGRHQLVVVYSERFAHFGQMEAWDWTHPQN